MSAVITAERPDAPDALLLINELQSHLESFYEKRLPGDRPGQTPGQ
jgi:hypothetical protein